MCGGRFSGVTHPYTYKPYTLYRCGCVGSEYTYIVNVISYIIVICIRDVWWQILRGNTPLYI